MGMMAAGGSQALGNAGIRNQGGQAGFLGGPGAIDGSMQSFMNVLDPGDITGLNKTPGSSPFSMQSVRNLLDPGNVLGFNQASNPLTQNQGANSPATLPNLGAQSMIPTMPGGSFGAANFGSGPFNDMANQSAGQIFTPSGIQAQTSQPASQPATLGGTKPSVNTGGTQYSPNALPGGGGNPALGSPAGSALSKSQIYGGNVGPNGVTEPGDPAFLNQLHNGMMAAIKAQYSTNGSPVTPQNNNINMTNPFAVHMQKDPMATGTTSPGNVSTMTAPTPASSWAALTAGNPLSIAASTMGPASTMTPGYNSTPLISLNNPNAYQKDPMATGTATPFIGNGGIVPSTGINFPTPFVSPNPIAPNVTTPLIGNSGIAPPVGIPSSISQALHGIVNNPLYSQNIARSYRYNRNGGIS